MGDNRLTVDVEGNLVTTARDWVGVWLSLSSNTSITDGQWHRVGLVWDNAGTRALYIDGIEVATDDPGLLGGYAFDAGFRIGAPKRLNHVGYWSGLIGYVRIYNRAVRP